MLFVHMTETVHMLQGVTPQWLRWMFGRIATRYDRTNTVISLGLDHYWRRCLARRAVSTMPHVVLDVACGTGGVLYQTARMCGPETRLLGIDFTPRMLHVAQTQVARKILYTTVHLCLADAQHVPCRNASCDAVTMMFGLRNFAHPLGSLMECHRVLRPGGRLYIVEFSWPSHPLVRTLYSGYFRYILPLAAWPLTGERTAYRYLRDSVMDYRRQPRPEVLLAAAGFTRVQSQPLSGGITTLYEATKPVLYSLSA